MPISYHLDFIGCYLCYDPPLRFDPLLLEVRHCHWLIVDHSGYLLMLNQHCRIKTCILRVIAAMSARGTFEWDVNTAGINHSLRYSFRSFCNDFKGEYTPLSIYRSLYFPYAGLQEWICMPIGSAPRNRNFP